MTHGGDRPGAHAERAPPPRHTSTAETLSAMPTPLREDVPERAHMLSRLELLNTVGPDFARTPLRHVAPGRDGELLYRAAGAHSLTDVIADGFLKPPAGGNAACHRIAVFDFDAAAAAHAASLGGGDATPTAPGAPIRVTAVVSQTDVVRWLAQRIASGQAGPLPRATLSSLGLTPKDVVCVDANEPAIDAYAKLLSAKLPAAGVISKPSGGALVAALTLADLKGVQADKLGVLALPVVSAC